MEINISTPWFNTQNKREMSAEVQPIYVAHCLRNLADKHKKNVTCFMYTQKQKRSGMARSKLKVPQKTVWFHYRMLPAVISLPLRPKSNPHFAQGAERSSFHDWKMDLRWNDVVFLISPWESEVQRRINTTPLMNRVRDRNKCRETKGETWWERQMDSRVLSLWWISVEFLTLTALSTMVAKSEYWTRLRERS